MVLFFKNTYFRVILGDFYRFGLVVRPSNTLQSVHTFHNLYDTAKIQKNPHCHLLICELPKRYYFQKSQVFRVFLWFFEFTRVILIFWGAGNVCERVKNTRVELSTVHNTYTTHTAVYFSTLFFKYNTHVTQLCIHMFTQVHTC